MDLLEPAVRRRRPSATAGVAVALGLLAAGQAAAVTRTPALPPGVTVEVLPNGYSYSTAGDQVRLGFQLRNSGRTTVRVTGIGADLPGLALADVVASGEPFRFTAVGQGPGALPVFALSAGTVIEINLIYRVRRCREVPGDVRPVPVALAVGRARGVRPVPVPGLPSEAVDAGPDDEDPWQRVLVRDVCR